MRFAVLLGVVAWGLAAIGAASASPDPVSAEALWRYASQRSSDRADDAYVDPARLYSATRPWHAGWTTARARLTEIGTAPRRELTP